MARSNKGFRLLNRLFDNGYTTEKAITAMTIDDMLALPGITLSDLAQLVALQRSVKDNRVITFLAEGRENTHDNTTEHPLCG